MSYKSNPSKRTKPPRTRYKIYPVDANLLIIVIILSIFGTVAVFSAGAPEGADYYQNPLYYPIKHLIFGVIGFIFMAIAALIDYKKWKKWAIPISVVIILLIVATLIPGLGKTTYGSSRWLTFLPVQPSEFGKFACVILAASALSQVKSLFDEKMLVNFGLIVFMMGVIFIQPNLSIFLLLAGTCVAMALAAGMSYRMLLLFGACSLPVLLMKIKGTTYQMNRIQGWLDPFSDPQGIGYNLIQSWYAISSGGLLGVGLGNSKQKLYWLPFGHTDFIFAVIAEELGFLGSVCLIILFVLFIKRGFKISARCEDKFGKLLGFGITFIIGAQAFINMCVATGVFPVTGVTLPLISYGGSSFMITTFMIGILLNISRKRTERVEHE
ncbi:MAG: putative lipid II flippase FtsW [Candidatus Gastranaerophilales bacterium]|nr:putative lipid II flippase FtsW [Candidatus Gastranaerophilales bacterium]